MEESQVAEAAGLAEESVKANSELAEDCAESPRLGDDTVGFGRYSAGLGSDSALHP